MKMLMFCILALTTIQARAETFSVDGKFILGRVFFDKGQDAKLNLFIEHNRIDAALESPTSECVFSFGQGTLERNGKEKFFPKGSYEVYTLPLVERCKSVATNPIYLVIRKDREGQLTSVKIVNRSSNHRWVYFTTNL